VEYKLLHYKELTSLKMLAEYFTHQTACGNPYFAEEYTTAAQIQYSINSWWK